MAFWLWLVGIALIIAFGYFFRKATLFIIIVGGLIFVSYKLGLFGLLFRKVFGYG